MFSSSQSLSTACIICSKLSYDFHIDALTTEQERLRRFFNLLERYLDSSHKHKFNNQDSYDVFPIEELVNAGMISCVDCSKVVESFCQLYHQMKVIELLLDGKVRTLKNIILGAQRLPIRMKRFRDNVAQLEMDITADDIVDFKADLVKKCNRKLSTSFPLLRLDKCMSKKEPGKSGNDVKCKPNQTVIDPELVRNSDPSSEPQLVDTKLFGDPQADTPKVDNEHISVGGDPNDNSKLMECDICHLSVSDLSTHLYISHFESESTNILKMEEDPEEEPTIPTVSEELSREVGPDKMQPDVMGPVTTNSPPPVPIFSGYLNKSQYNPLNGKHTCNLCFKKFRDGRTFRLYYLRDHRDGVKPKCIFCNEEFENMRSLWDHRQSVHFGKH